MKRRDLFKGLLAMAVAPFVPKRQFRTVNWNATVERPLIWRRRIVSRAEVEARYPSSVAADLLREVEESDRRVQAVTGVSDMQALGRTPTVADYMDWHERMAEENRNREPEWHL